MQNSTPTNSSLKRKVPNGVPGAHKELGVDFLCPVCFEILEEAHVTKCGHTFCFKCITDSLETGNRCPQCNFTIEHFFPNFLLNEMISKYKSEKIKDKNFSMSFNPSQKPSELQKVFMEKYDELSLHEINHLVDMLNTKKSRLEEDIQMKQNELLKEFLERALKHKTEQFEQLQREMENIKEDYSTLLEIIKNDNAAVTQESPAISDTSDQAVPLSSADRENLNRDELSDNDSPAKVGAGLRDEYHHFDPATPGCSTDSPSTSTSDPPRFSKSRDFVPSFNSLGFGECEHTEPIRKENEHKKESYLNARRNKMNFYFHDLETNYFSRFQSDAFLSKDSTTRLHEFKETLTKFTHFSNLRPLASLNYAKEYIVHNIVSSIEFDKDSEFFAIAGVAKKIKIFDYAAVVKDALGINYPVNEIECTSKISCLSWNSYYKAMMATSDYEGSVIIWDAFLGKRLATFQEHEKRCWSVDFNKIDINLVASGSDDGKVKLWSSNTDSSITTITSSANICSVKFNPKSLYHLAFGSADHRVYYYDLRNIRQPLTTFKEHRKAVSYVKFLNEHELVSASTDSQIKLWNTEQSSCLRSYKGHINDKNFVGLTANDDYIACGSENNSLYVYYKGIERQMLSFCFEKLIERDETTDFVSAVCWRTGSNILVAANSTGNIKILELV